MGSLGAAEPRRQPRHRQQQEEEEEEEEEPGSLERVEKSRKKKKKRKPKQRTNKQKNQNEKPNGRSKYDMKIRGQMSRQMPRRREGRGWQRRETRRAWQCRGVSWWAGEGPWGGPHSGAQELCLGPWQRGQKRGQGWVGPTCPSGYSSQLKPGSSPGNGSRGQSTGEVGRTAEGGDPCPTDQPARPHTGLSSFEATWP